MDALSNRETYKLFKVLMPSGPSIGVLHKVPYRLKALCTNIFFEPSFKRVQKMLHSLLKSKNYKHMKQYIIFC